MSAPQREWLILSCMAPRSMRVRLRAVQGRSLRASAPLLALLAHRLMVAGDAYWRSATSNSSFTWGARRMRSPLGSVRSLLSSITLFMFSTQTYAGRGGERTASALDWSANRLGAWVAHQQLASGSVGHFADQARAQPGGGPAADQPAQNLPCPSAHRVDVAVKHDVARLVPLGRQRLVELAGMRGAKAQVSGAASKCTGAHTGSCPASEKALRLGAACILAGAAPCGGPRLPPLPNPLQAIQTLPAPPHRTGICWTAGRLSSRACPCPGHRRARRR